LIGTKGDIPCPALGTQDASLIMAPSGEHSEKPECFMAMIERYFPTLPKLELNSRRSRPGWTVWGLDARAPISPTDLTTGEILGEAAE
jgi:N6-adenosine-specific RNA methylase IME4